MKINHIGIITKHIDVDVLMYERIGYRVISEVVDTTQMNKVTILKGNHAPNIELVEAINDNSTIKNFTSGYHHICFEAEENEDIVALFKKMNVGKIFTHPIVAPALNFRKVVFACLYNGSFIELIL